MKCMNGVTLFTFIFSQVDNKLYTNSYIAMMLLLMWISVRAFSSAPSVG